MQDYQAFVDKFKPKLTTDDCYTPPAVYDAVRDWAVKEYGLEGRLIVRPFYPGGDYEHFAYPDGCVVIDNPPFSILKNIKMFYADKKIKYFLFAPHLTLFCSDLSETSYIVADASITYANGAVVKTSFVTNMDESFIRTAPELKNAINTAKVEHKKTASLPKYVYPDCVISAALLGKISDVDFSLNRDECGFVRALDAQRPFKKAIFGSGFLISERKAAERKAAERKAAERKAAERKVAVPSICWELSPREKDTVRELSACKEE